MSLSDRLNAFIVAVGADIKSLQARPAPKAPKIELFTTAGSTTWTKDPLAKMFLVTLIGGGGGGQAGGVTAANAIAYGGAGGDGGAGKQLWVPTEFVNDAAISIVVGAGGAGGTGDRGAGSSGGSTSVYFNISNPVDAQKTLYASVQGGLAGSAARTAVRGTVTNSGGGEGGYQNGTNFAVNGQRAVSDFGAGGGGSGLGITAANVAATTAISGGGTSDIQGNAPFYKFFVSPGDGGYGNSSNTAANGSAGNPGKNFGGGGGGGGATRTGFSSGAGGAGAAGAVSIVSFY